MKRRNFITTLAAASLAGCSKSAPTAASGKLRVLTSFLPLQSHTAAIAGGLVSVEQLLTKDAGPHDFQFTPADVRKLAEADLFIVNGQGLEQWLEVLVTKAASPQLVLVDCSATIKPEPNPKPMGSGAIHTAGGNPHFWLDPLLAKTQATTILGALQKAAPTHSAAFAENAAAYLKKLDALHEEFRTVLDPLPNKNLVTFHDAFPYLATRYGLNYVGCVAEFPEKDPPPQQLAALIEAIRAAKPGVIFAESGYAPSLLTEIARQTGTRVSQLDTLEIGDGNADAYLKRMRNNLASLHTAFTTP